MSNNVLNINLTAKGSPTVYISVNEAGSVSGSGSVSPVVKFVASGEAGPQGAQGPQGTIEGTDVVTTTNIQNSAVTTLKLDDDSVTNDKLAPNSVYGDAISNYAITSSKLGTDSVTSDKIEDNAVTSDHIAPGAINEELIESGIITNASIASKTISSAEIQNRTLVKENFQLGTIDGTVIVNNLTLTGVLTTNGYKNLGQSPGVYEGPEDNDMHLKYHQGLDFVNTSGTIVAGFDQSGNFSLSGTVDGIDIATDVAANTLKNTYPTTDSTKVGYLTVTQSLNLDSMKAKLDGIEANATGDQTAAEIRALVDLAYDSEVFTDADHAKLDGIEANATADQTAEEIQDIVGPFIATGGTKTGISITYDDDSDNMDFVVDHDAATNFVAEEHYRWDNDIQSTATINHANLSSDTANNGEVLAVVDGDAVWGHPEKVHIEVKNGEGATIPAGAPLYSKGEVGSSNRILVGICDANDSAKMPCIGIAETEMNTSSTQNGFAIISGIYNTNISGFTSLDVGDNLYIQDDGSLSQTKPLGESSKVQNVGIVLKTNGTTCQGMLVSAIGRTNDVPNLNSGNIFLGNSSNSPQETSVAAAVEGAGNITIDGDLKLNDDIVKGSSGNVILSSYSDIVKTPLGLFTNSISGYNNTDFELKAGGNVQFTLDVDDNETAQSFSFRDGGAYGTFTEIANLNQSGDLVIEGDLTVKGNDIKRNDGTVCMTFNAAATANIFYGNLVGDVNGDVIGDLTGNADTATALTAGNKTLDGNLTIGGYEAGHDLTVWGDTAGAYMTWDSTYDHLKLGDAAKIAFGSGVHASDFDSSIQGDGSNLVIYNDTGNVQIGDTVEITGDLNITGDFKVSGNDIKNSNDSSCITFGTTADNVVNINNQLRVGATGTGNGVNAYFYSDDANKYMWWEHDNAHFHLEDNTKIVFGSGAISYSSDSQIYADGSDLKIENSEGNIKIGDTVEITGDLDVDGTITATKIESATQFSHEGDANTGLEFSSDTVTIEANNENVAVFSSSAITFDEALSMGSNGDGKSLNLYGSTSGVKIAWSAYGNALLINDNTRVNFGTPSGGPSGDVYFNFDGTKLQLAPSATNGDNIFEITKPGTGTTSLNLEGDLTVDGDIAAGGNLTGVTNFIDVKTTAYWSSSTAGFYLPSSGSTTGESTSLSTSTYTAMFVAPFDGKIKRISSFHQNAASGTSTFEVYIDGDDSDLTTDQRGSDMTTASYTRKFTEDCPSDWTFSKGEAIAIRRTDSVARYGVTLSIVFEYDTTT